MSGGQLQVPIVWLLPCALIWRCNSQTFLSNEIWIFGNILQMRIGLALTHASYHSNTALHAEIGGTCGSFGAKIAKPVWELSKSAYDTCLLTHA